LLNAAQAAANDFIAKMEHSFTHEYTMFSPVHFLSSVLSSGLAANVTLARLSPGRFV
jgi:hypothetical protein